MNELWRRVFDAVQDARVKHDMAPLARNGSMGQFGLQMMGLTHSALAFLVEQLPGAEELEQYNFKHHTDREKEVLVENVTGSARTESYNGRNPLDMVRHHLLFVLMFHALLLAIFVGNNQALQNSCSCKIERKVRGTQAQMVLNSIF